MIDLIKTIWLYDWFASVVAQAPPPPPPPPKVKICQTTSTIQTKIKNRRLRFLRFISVEQFFNIHHIFWSTFFDIDVFCDINKNSKVYGVVGKIFNK